MGEDDIEGRIAIGRLELPENRLGIAENVRCTVQTRNEHEEGKPLESSEQADSDQNAAKDENRNER